MLKLIGSVIKFTVFTISILLLGSYVHWDGKTLSSHVTDLVGQAKQAVETPIVNTFSGHSPISTMTKQVHHFKAEAKRRITEKATSAQKDLLSATERMRLRSLISEVETKPE